MASGKMTSSEYTRDGGSGPSEGLSKKGEILSAYPQENVTDNLKDKRGGKFGGSATNLSHSLSDDAAVQNGK